MNRSIIWALAIVAMVGCQKESDTAGSSDELVSFYSASIATRTTNYYDHDHVTQWVGGDVIAVSAPELGYSRIEYEATDTGTGADFSAVGDKIYKSVNYEGEVTYSAYYPTSAYENGSYVMDVEDQTEGYMAKDLLYAENSIEYDPTILTNNTVGFTFCHALSLIKFSVDFKDITGTSTYGVEIADVTTEASYTVESGSMVLSQELESGSVSMYTDRENSTIKNFYATVHSLSYGGKTITLTLDGNEYYALYPDDAALEPGYMYTHEVIVGEDGVTIGTATIDDWEYSEEEGGEDYVYNVKDTWDGSIAKGFEGANGAVVPFEYLSLDASYEEVMNTTMTYYIKTGAQLAYLAKIVNEGFDSNSSGTSERTFVLLNDIDLGDHEWTPIGGEYLPFQGTFKGEEYTISGLSITGENDNVGLFGQATGTSTIKDLIVEGSVEGRDYAAGIVGYGFGSIDNCHFSGDVTAVDHVGGIVGFNGLYGSVTYSSNSATIKGCTNVGGIAGINNYAAISRCYNCGSIEKADDAVEYFGGIAGYNNESEISACHNSANVTGLSYVGGIVGMSTDEGDSGSIVTSCYNTGTISASVDYSGGVAGFITEGTYLYSSTSGLFGTTYNGRVCDYYGTFNVDDLIITYTSDTQETFNLLDDLNAGVPNAWETDTDVLPTLSDMRYSTTTTNQGDID